MSDLRELYQEVILDHAKGPRNFRKLDGANRRAVGHNPLCGDKITVFATVDDGAITDISFLGAGCAISTASASVMTEALKGCTLDEAEEVFQGFHALVTGNDPGERDLGKLLVFAGVAEYPMRVKCASLAWHTLHAALEKSDESITTE